MVIRGKRAQQRWRLPMPAYIHRSTRPAGRQCGTGRDAGGWAAAVASCSCRAHARERGHGCLRPWAPSPQVCEVLAVGLAGSAMHQGSYFATSPGHVKDVGEGSADHIKRTYPTWLLVADRPGAAQAARPLYRCGILPAAAQGPITTAAPEDGLDTKRAACCRPPGHAPLLAPSPRAQPTLRTASTRSTRTRTQHTATNCARAYGARYLHLRLRARRVLALEDGLGQ